MGASVPENNLVQEVSQLKAMMSELVQELSMHRKAVGFIPLPRASESPDIPFGRKKLEALYDAGDIRGFREQGRGRGQGELILDLASIRSYCERRAAEGEEDQARARHFLKEMGLGR